MDIIDKAKEFKPAATALVAFSVSRLTALRKRIADHDQHNHAYTIVDTADKVREMVDTLVALPTNEPNIGADFEGKELGRDGELYLVIIHDYVADHTYIVDIFHLQSAAFDTTGTDKHATLKSILESAKIPKLFWDVRQDSDAIFHHFGVKLSGILDVQLFIMAEMSKDYMYPRRKRPGLFNMLYYTLDMDLAQKNRWTWIKYHGKALWDPKQGGSFDRFTDRKKRFEIIEYCCGDVAYLRPLYRKAVRFLPDDWKEKVRIATTSSIEETWEENFESSGVWGPWQ